MSCEYKDIFGKPREGAHALRIPVADLALVDVIGTIAIIFAIVHVTSWSYTTVTIGVILLFVILHKLFCVDTALNKVIFGKN